MKKAVRKKNNKSTVVLNGQYDFLALRQNKDASGNVLRGSDPNCLRSGGFASGNMATTICLSNTCLRSFLYQHAMAINITTSYQ